MDPAYETNSETGVFGSTLIMQPKAGNEAVIVAQLAGDDDAKATYHKVVVVPGKPSNVVVTTEGTVSVMEYGEMTVDVSVTDQFGNPVKDGTSVNLSIQGDAVLDKYEPGTLDGKVTAKVIGRNFASQDNKLVVQVDEIVKEVEFEVYPLTVTIEDAPTTVEVGTFETVTVKVVDHEGEPAAEASVAIAATRGRMQNNTITTDANGMATVSFHTSFAPGPGRIMANVGLGTVGAKYNYTVTTGPAGRITQADLMLVGDETEDGYSEYVRYDEQTIGIAYETHADMNLAGTPSETATVKRDDLVAPNIEPLVSLGMNGHGEDKALDDTGLHNGVLNNITVVEDHPLGLGRSFSFDNHDPENALYNSWVAIPSAASLKPTGDIGFRLHLKPQNNVAGEVLNHESGSQLVKFENGHLVYSVQTTNGTAQIESVQDIATNFWHTVVGRYVNGRLELVVDGQPQTPVEIGGDLVYGPDICILLGRTYQGKMSGF